MKTKIFTGSFSLLSALLLSLSIAGQPCDNDISTNPENPINDQFVQMGNDFFPLNGTTDTHNPFLNRFNWYWGESTITLYPQQVNWAHGFPNNLPTLPMQHPYGGSMPTEFQYLRPNNVNPSFRDFRWEDGWELLYMNLGYFPDTNHTNAPAAGSYYANHGQYYDPLPSNIPYFVIYNRYRGLMRLFANVWYPVDGNYSNINVTLKFTPQSGIQSKLTGLLRHGSAYDVALSEMTSITALHAPRFHAPNYTQWIVADFQMAYDPCTCQSQGELEFVFTAFNTLDVDIIGRSISLDVPINDTTYTTRDFLNLSDINGDYVPGTEIYQNMDRMAEKFEEAQLKYLQDLEEYNQYNPFAVALQKFGVKQVAKFLSGGLSNIIFNDSLVTWVANDDWRDAATLEEMTPAVSPEIVKNKFAEKAKGLIGETFGFLATEIFSPIPSSKPVPPAVPVATLEESVYKGTISAVDTTYSSPLIIPGSLPHAYPFGTTLEPNRLPVYNEVLGQVALLDIPEVNVYFDSASSEDTLAYESWPSPSGNSTQCALTKEVRSTFEFHLKFEEEPAIAMNPSLDFDTTRTFVQVNVTFENDVDPAQAWFFSPHDFNPYTQISDDSNLRLTGEVHESDRTTFEFNSKWIPLKDLNQMVFKLKFDDVFEFEGETESFSGFSEACDLYFPFNITSMEHEVKKVTVKFLHDMYFDQIGSSNEQINVIQVHTYKLFDREQNVNFLGDTESWTVAQPETFDQYITGVIYLGNETITTTHPFVHEVIGNEIFINAQEVQIAGPIQVEAGYTLVVQALEQINATTGASFNPNVHLRIKKDFYNTPVFEYADNSMVASFCNNSTAYQANTASKALRERLKAQQEQAELEELTAKVIANNTVALYPNPANGAIQLRSSDLGISQVDVYDIAGRLMLQRNYGADAGKQVQMDIENLQTGVYIVQIHCGAQVHKEKLVVGL